VWKKIRVGKHHHKDDVDVVRGQQRGQERDQREGKSMDGGVYTRENCGNIVPFFGRSL